MNKQEFLISLKKCLSGLPEEEQQNYISYFEEIINDRVEDGMTEEQAVSSLESVEKIAGHIQEDFQGQQKPEGGLVFIDKTQNQEKQWDRTLNESYVKKEKIYPSDAIKMLILDTKDTSIVLGCSPDNHFYMSYMENNRDYYEINCSSDGILRIQNVRNYRWFDHFKMRWIRTKSFDLLVPKECMAQICLKTSNGSIQAKEMDVRSNMQLKSSNAAIKAREIKVGGCLKCITSNGKVLVEEGKIRELKAESSNGSICLDTVCCDKHMKGRTSNGSIHLKYTKADTVQLVTSNASLQMECVEALTTISAGTSNGSLRFQSLSGGKELRLYTSNGNITGTLLEDGLPFGEVSAHTSNGKCCVPQATIGGHKKLSASTSNGNIQITLE